MKSMDRGLKRKLLKLALVGLVGRRKRSTATADRGLVDGLLGRRKRQAGPGQNWDDDSNISMRAKGNSQQREHEAALRKNLQEQGSRTYDVLQGRATVNGTTYIPCYFNPVSCF